MPARGDQRTPVFAASGDQHTPVFAASGEYTDQVLRVVESIPPGRVMTYGDVARVFGRAGARAVGMVLARYGSAVPWWRVVRAAGHPPTGHAARAREHYLAEQTPLVETDTPDGYRIDLRRAGWFPAPA